MEEKNKVKVWKEELIPMSIIDDGRQLSIRIPKKIVEALEIDPKEDIFVFYFDKENLDVKGKLVNKDIEKWRKEN